MLLATPAKLAAADRSEGWCVLPDGPTRSDRILHDPPPWPSTLLLPSPPVQTGLTGMAASLASPVGNVGVPSAPAWLSPGDGMDWTERDEAVCRVTCVWTCVCVVCVCALYKRARDRRMRSGGGATAGTPSCPGCCRCH